MTSRNTFYLVRHGESTFNRDGIIQGQTDTSVLTARGFKQAGIVGDYLHGIDFSSFFCSPLTRARQTATIIAQKMGLPTSSICFDEHLVEIDFKSWAGLAKQKVTNEFQFEYAVWRTTPYDFCLDNHYPVRELYDRLNTFMNKFMNPNTFAGNVLIVGHRGSLSGLIINLLKLPKASHHRVVVRSGSIIVISELRRSSSEIIYELRNSHQVFDHK